MFRNMFILFLLMSVNVANAEIYKWVDAQGKTHYGDKPAKNAKEMDVNVAKQGSVKTSTSRDWKREKLLESYADDRKRKNKANAKKKKERKQRKKSCALYKNKMIDYNRARSLYDLDKQGNRVTLSDAERDRSTTDLKNKINKYCK